MITDISLRVDPRTAAKEEELKIQVARESGIAIDNIHDMKIVKRSIDARQRNVKVNLTVKIATDGDSEVAPDFKMTEYRELSDTSRTVVIVGAGPAGLFAALRALELGIRPIVLERGMDVDSRRLKLAEISREGKVDPDTNYCFGEGGAGAYSDGKLFTRSKKRGNVGEILSLLHQFGASRDILIDAHPHIGSDRLPSIIKNIRENIIRCGGDVRFQTKVTEIIVEDGIAKGVRTSNGDYFEGAVILSTGHSARDIYRMLNDSGIRIEAKGLAIGVRLEHPQQLIDKLQYHSPNGRGKYLPAAEYNFVTQSGGRGVYSFCMCPGGVIVPSMSSMYQSVVNGMSASARASRWSNSGMVVELHPGDINGFSKYGPLEMMMLQEELEKKFYEESDSINAPAQRMRDFVEGRESAELPASSYAPGVHSCRMDKLLPIEISGRLKEGFLAFDKKCRGFLTNDAILVGLESRTSSPVRIPRKSDKLEHVEISHLYPAGEGAGYAGGIVSAAIDGRRCLDAYYESIKDVSAS